MKDIDAIRRENLRLIETDAGGTTEAATLCGMSPSQFANLRDGAKDSKTGKPRGMRKETARRIEAAAGKQPGWLDVDHSLASQPGAPLSPSNIGPTPSLAQALETVANALSRVPPEKRQALVAVLSTYAANPQGEEGSLAYLHGELTRAAALPPVVQKALEPGLGVESAAIFDPARQQT
jgi:hypothetical protein